MNQLQLCQLLAKSILEDKKITSWDPLIDAMIELGFPLTIKHHTQFSPCKHNPKSCNVIKILTTHKNDNVILMLLTSEEQTHRNNLNG